MSKVETRIGGWIETRSGKAFYPLDPREEDVDINDIAHALSLLTRFNGHCSHFYSIAEHSVRVADHFADSLLGLDGDYPRLTLRALLHDAAEAYVSDMPRPTKQDLPQFKVIEDKISEVIYRKYGIDDKSLLSSEGSQVDFDGDIHCSDMVLLATEARDLGLNRRGDWYMPFDPIDEKIEPMTFKEARDAFLEYFHKLT